MASLPSHVQALLPGTSCLKLNFVEQQDSGRVLITAGAFASAAYCPACHHASDSLHSRYSRFLRDLPWQGATVELRPQCSTISLPVQGLPPCHVCRIVAVGLSQIRSANESVV